MLDTNGDVTPQISRSSCAGGPDDQKTVLRLYHAAAERQSGEFILSCVEPQRSQGMKKPKLHAQRFKIGDNEAMAGEARQRAKHSNVYFGPALMRSNIRAGCRGKKTDITSILGLVLEEDGDTNKLVTLPRDVDPTFEIETSNNPTFNRHFHFLYDEPLPPKEATELAELAYRKCRGDSGCKDIAHIWRLPDTLNFPCFRKIGRGRPPEPQAVKLIGGTGKSVSVEDLRAALLAMPDRRRRKESSAVAQPFNGEPIGDRDKIIKTLPGWLIAKVGQEGEDRSKHCADVVLSLFKLGFSDGEVLAVASGAAFARKYDKRGDLVDEISRLHTLWVSEGSPLSHSSRFNSHNNAGASQSVDDGEDDLEHSNWPKLDGHALHGFAGRFSKAAIENSEADIVAVLITLLTYVGICVDRILCLYVGDTEHHARLFALIIGATGRSRKGISEGPVNRLFRLTHNLLSGTPGYGYGEMRMQRGLATGEGLAHAVRDADLDKDDDKGVLDKRLLIVESEFAQILKQAKRLGNIINPTIRNSWDGVQIGSLTKTDKSICKHPHIGLVGHITRQEFLAEISDTDIANGFLNRFIMLCVRRSKLVALPPPMPDDTINECAKELRDILFHARKINQLDVSDEARLFWEMIYRELTKDKPGKVGMLTSRAEAQVLRLAMIYALLDKSRNIEEDHLRAALALWFYAEQSIRHLFETPAARVALTRREKLEGALMEGDMSRNEIRDLFSGHVKRSEIDQLLDELLAEGKIRTFRGQSSGGKPPTMVSWMHDEM